MDFLGRLSSDSGREDGIASGLAGQVHEEEDDDEINNTLYELTDLQEYIARKVEAEDIRAIRNLLTDEDYNKFQFEDPVILFETCCFSLAIFDVIESDRLVAAAFFDDKPANPDLMKLAKKWKHSYDLKSMAPINTLHLRCFICNPEVAEDVCLTEIISHTFSSSIHIDYIIVEMPNLSYTGSYSFSPLVKELEISTGHHEKRKIVVYKKDLLMPHLLVREGREHDLDDLMPLLPLNTPLMEQHFGKSNLSDIIAMSEKGNQSMVAEWKAEATGIISVSVDLDYDMLNDLYHLEPFHGLRKPHKSDQIFVDDDKIKNVMSDTFADLFQEADKSFQMRQAQKGQIQIQRQEAARQPYDIELIKEFSMADIGLSDTDSSGLEKIMDDKPPKPHLFTTKVSDDIIMYGLRKRIPDEEEEEEEETSSLTISGSKSPGVSGTTTSGGEPLREDAAVETTERYEDDDEEEDEDDGGEADGEEDDDEIIEVTDKDNGDKPLGSQLSISGSGGSDRTSLHDGAKGVGGKEKKEEIIQMLIDLEDGEEEEEGEKKDEDGGLIVPEVITTPSPVQADATSTEQPQLEVLEGQEGQVAIEGGTLEVVAVDEMSGATTDQPTKEPSPSETETPDSVALALASKRSGGDESILSPTTESDAGAHRSEAVEDETSIMTTERQSFMPHNMQATAIEPSNAEILDRNIALLQEMSPEMRRRISEDTFFVGPRISQKTFDQKTLLFKKVCDIYNMIQQSGLSLNEAKAMITDMDFLEEAELLTTENLLKYITALIPDDSRYPFQKNLEVLEKPGGSPRKKSNFHGIPNALAVKMFNMNKKHMLRHMDLFRDIFKPFPNKEYLVVTVPIGDNIREPSWLQNFVRVIPRVESSYPRDLFILHKVAITAKLRVRRAKEKDVGRVREFLSSLIDKAKIFQDFLTSLRKGSERVRFSGTGIPPKFNCFLAEVKNYEEKPIIGLAIVSTETEVFKYSVNYNLEKHTYFAAHDITAGHGYLHHLIINPLFQRHCKLILKEVMRLDGKQCLYHRVYPDYLKNETVKHQSIINNMEDWVPLMPRKRVHYDDLGLTEAYDDDRQPPPYVQDMSDPYALIHIGKKLVLEPKIMLTNRLVFVGASTTSISCLEKLISSSYRSFKYLTVIDPFGLPGTLPHDPIRNEFFALRNGGTKMSYQSDSEWIQRTGIHLWVQVVIGRVTSIVRDGKYVVVDSDYIVPYDKLVLAPGQQFQRLDCPEPEINDPNFTAFKKNTATHALQEPKDLKFNRDIPKPKNVFLINNEVEANLSLDFLRRFRPFMKKKKVLIFGGGLPTFCCIKALIAAGIPANRIVLIGTHDKDIAWERKSGYILSSKVKIPIRRELQMLGVSIVDNYEFSHWETCPLSGLAKRTHFKSMTERDAHISFSTFALFCYRYRRVDDGIVSALSEAYILYQDGIVIDAGFRTNDHNIYAAGPAATYQKILLADHQNHMYCQSEEIGAKLAEFLIETSGMEGGGQGKLENFNVIKFKRPLIRAVKLLGGWHYLFLRSPGNHSRCSDFHGSGSCEEICECTTEVVTGSVNPEEDPKQKFFKLRLDDKQKIVSLECMSKEPFSFSNMSALYGQHETLLNKMMERLESGETTCLFDHFQQSWFSVFCIDEWDNFMDQLNGLYREHDIGGGVNLVEFIRDFISNLDNPEALQMDPNIIRSVWRSSGLKDIVEEKLLNFLKFHRLSLPMYATHDYVEDLLEERSTSALYYPNTKAHMVQ